MPYHHAHRISHLPPACAFHEPQSQCSPSPAFLPSASRHALLFLSLPRLSLWQPPFSSPLPSGLSPPLPTWLPSPWLFSRAPSSSLRAAGPPFPSPHPVPSP